MIASFFPEKRMSKLMRREGGKDKRRSQKRLLLLQKIPGKGKADRNPASAVEQSFEPVSVDPEKTREGPCLISLAQGDRALHQSCRSGGIFRRAIRKDLNIAK